MTEKFKTLFEWKINLTTITTLTILLLSWAVGYGEFKAERKNFATKTELQTAAAKTEVLANEVHIHFAEDNQRFGEFATKESRAERDKAIDTKLTDILDRVKRIESMHMTK